MHAVALTVGGDNGVVAQESVDEADGGAVVGQETAPFLSKARWLAIARLRRS